MTEESNAKNPCPHLYPMRILSRKWSYLIMRSLRSKKTFSQLSVELRFITNRILSRELKALQAEGIVVCEHDYFLTDRGKALLLAAEPLATWSINHCGRAACPGAKSCATCENYHITIGAKHSKK